MKPVGILEALYLRSHEGTQTDLELCSYDAEGTKTKVQFLFPPEDAAECATGNACGSNMSYSIEGTDSSYGAPGAKTMTVTYDKHNLPKEVLFHDANHRLVNRVVFQRDSEGRLLIEEARGSEGSPFQAILDQLPPDRYEEMAARFQQVLGETISSITYTYDSEGRVVKREHRIGGLGGDSTTYSYDAHDNPTEETVEHRSREAEFDEAGTAHYSPDRVTVQHNRLEYRYDSHGNWIERVMSYRHETDPDYLRSNIERRVITYHDL